MHKISATVSSHFCAALIRRSASSLLLGACALLLTSVPAARAQNSTPVATLNDLVSFGSIAGINPYAGPIQGMDGAFYGVNYSGGIYGQGTIYRHGTDGTLTTLHSFGLTDPSTGYSADGSGPMGALIQAPQPDGFFYGTCTHGGRGNSGTVFKIAADGTGFTVLHSFNYDDGDSASAALTLGQDGYLYGTTQTGGADGNGDIFLLSTDGTTFVDLHDFVSDTEGYASRAPLVQDVNGTFYGALSAFGPNNGGAIFSFTVFGTGAGATGTLNILYAFTGGGTGGPVGNLVLDGGVLYGVTQTVGANNDGEVFSVPTPSAPAGAMVADPLYSFAGGNDGATPRGGLILVNGLLYGTCSVNGPADYGTVFSIAEDGTGYQTLYGFGGFSGDGSSPLGALTLAADGTTLYGTTEIGGISNLGSLFQISANGTGYQSLVSFLINHQNPSGGVIQGADGAFYGTDSTGGAYSQGTVFRVDGTTGALTSLHDFGSGTDGQQPQAALVPGAGGYLYGTTQNGGGNGQGSIFRILPDGTNYQVIHSFASYGSGSTNADGALLVGSLIQSTDGFLYGAAQGGGAANDGTIFQISPDGTTFNVLHAFNRFVDGAFPVTALVQDASGLLYGTTRRGGNSDNNGTIFRLATDGTGFMTLRMLTASTDGAQPAGTLVLDPATGLLYGTTEIGGSVSGVSGGTVFQIAPDGTNFAVLANLPDGSFPESGLLLSQDGFLYGTTTGTNADTNGFIYRISTGGAFTDLYNFSADGTATSADGSPANLFESADGFLYGTSDLGGFSANGSVYQLAVTPVVDGGAISGQVGTQLSVQVSAFHNPTAFAEMGLPAGLSINPTTGVISGTPTTAGTFTATVSASNALGTGSAVFSVTILPLPPAITSGAPPEGQVGVPYSFQFSASHSPTAYSATGLPAGLTIDAETGAVAGTPASAGSFSVTFSATNAAATASAMYTLLIIPAAPVISSATSASTQAGLAFSYQIGASHNPTSFSASGLPGGLMVNSSTGLIFGTPATAGTYSVGLSASNAGGTGTAALTLTVTPAAVITPEPVINSAGTASGTVGKAFSYTITASNGATSFSSTTLPAGLTLQPSGVVSGTPTAAGTFTVTIRATNTTGSGTATLTITISAAPVIVTTPMPAITSAAGATGRLGAAFHYQIGATNSPTSFAATGLPAGLSVNAAGLISGTPTQMGTFTIRLSAANAGGTGTATLNLTITAAPVPLPSINSAATAAADLGLTFNYQITATNSPNSFAAAGLPDGLSLNSAGLIAGRPAVAGTFTITLGATNATGTGTARLTLTVTAVSKAPTISSPAAAAGQLGVVFAYQIGAANAPLTFAASGLPEGLRVGPAGLISGTPAKTGTFAVALSATNAKGTGTGTLTLRITAEASTAPVITSASSRAGKVNVAFNYQIAATNTPQSFKATNLPDGLAVTADGLISGKPTMAGTFTILLAATNAGGKGTATLTLTVAPAPLPVITLTASVPTVQAGSGNDGEFTLSRSGDISQDLTVAYMVEGTAVNGTDFVKLTGTRKIQAGMRTAPIRVVPIGDDGGKNVTHTVLLLLESRPDHYTVGTTDTVKVKITGD